MSAGFLTKTGGYLNQHSKPLLILSGLAIVFLVGVADYLTGAELRISIFYLIPIALITWSLNRRAGVSFAILSSCVELMTDLATGYRYSHFAIFYWNNAMQLGFYIIIVFILSALKRRYGETVKLNSDLEYTLSDLRKARDNLERKSLDLARSNAELEQFAYVAAHDLKQPLTVAGGHINRLRRLSGDKPSPEAETSIGYALDAITRMEALITGLLTYARVGTNASDLERVDCNVIVECAAANLQVEIEKSCAVVTHDRLPTLLADRIQVIQLFQNLIANGIKFRREEPPRVHISAEQKEREWVISVRDNGIGIDDNHSASIFKLFQRLHQNSKYPGNGIGLATCKKIVENHGGRIWVESSPGNGSTFRFSIPMR